MRFRSGCAPSEHPVEADRGQAQPFQGGVEELAGLPLGPE
jgi:hypothetical protein